MKFKEFSKLLSDDLYRCDGKRGFGCFWKHFFCGVGSKYIIWFRWYSYLRGHKLLKLTLGIPALIMLKHYRFKFGIELMPGTPVGNGLYISHCGGIVITGNAKIGRNCNLSHGVTIGVKNCGEHAGAPTIGDNVYIGPGAKVIGGITVGDNCIIGANAVITKDCPADSVMAGVPAKVIGSSKNLQYVNNKV